MSEESPISEFQSKVTVQSHLTTEQKEELDRRIADHLKNPNDVISWGQVKAKAREILEQGRRSTEGHVDQRDSIVCDI